MKAGIWMLVGFILAYPALAIVTVFAAMTAGYWAAFTMSSAIAAAFVPLVVAAAGAFASIPLILLGRWSTSSLAAALAPTVLTVTLLIGLTVLYALPPLHSLLGRVGHFGMFDHLTFLAMGFLILAAAIYLAGICRLLLALRRPLA